MITRAGLRKLLAIIITVLATLTGVKVVDTASESMGAIQRLNQSAE